MGLDRPAERTGTPAACPHERQSLKTIRRRIEHLIRAEGSPKNGYPLRGTRIQLAAELGVTPEALYRCLADLQAKGPLSIEAGCLRWHAK